MYKLILVILAAAIFCVRADTEEDAEPRQWLTSSTTSGRDKLMVDLFSNYNKENYPDNVTVKFGVALINVDFCLEHNMMNANVWHRIVWKDNRLTWDANETGISVLRVPPSKLWMPDIFLYNGPKPNIECSLTNALIYPNGEVLIVPPCKIQSYCNLTLSQRPLEEQRCMIKYGSWTFDSWTMDVVFYNNETSADVTDYMGGQQYEVTMNEAVRHVKKYDCCKEPYVDLQFNLGFKKVVEGGKCKVEKH